MNRLTTTLGPLNQEEIGMILPHEHVFTDLRNWQEAGYAEANAEDVIRLMKPELERARGKGISVIAESTPVGVGRRADILAAVSRAANFPLMIPTGVYREPWLPDWVVKSSVDDLARWMIHELNDGIETSGVQAAWIKISASDNGMTKNEAKVLQAAAAAGACSNAVIGSHTIKGHVVRTQLDLIGKNGYSARRFIWIHAQAEPDFNLHLEMARRGAWIEYDSIGNPAQDEICLDLIMKMVQIGLADQVLISQDRGWYDPSKQHGGNPLPYTYITDVFLPKLRQAGIDEDMIVKLTSINPFNAFSR
jgi:phosphotriesterase-related protein